MSFFINNTNTNRPGPICGNVLNGLNEKILIEVTRVFDACIQNETIQGVTLTTTGYTPAAPTLPLTYISTETDTTTGPTVSNVVITRLDNRPNFANVTGQVTFPLIMTYRDANGVLGTATSTYTTDFASVLCVPQPALSPVNITATGQLTSTIGTYTAENTFTITACVQIIIKVTAQVDILVPSYGYPCIPECQSIPTVCPGVGDISLYPTTVTQNTNLNNTTTLR